VRIVFDVSPLSHFRRSRGLESGIVNVKGYLVTVPHESRPIWRGRAAWQKGIEEEDATGLRRALVAEAREGGAALAGAVPD
jgi:hypothetical protein